MAYTEESYDSDMTHSYRLIEGWLIRYPLMTHCVKGVPSDSVSHSSSLSNNQSFWDNFPIILKFDANRTSYLFGHVMTRSFHDF